MADEKGTKVSPQDQASASGPKNPEPQDNGSDTAAASSVPTPASSKDDPKAKDDGTASGTASDTASDKDSKDVSSGRGTGLHR